MKTSVASAFLFLVSGCAASPAPSPAAPTPPPPSSAVAAPTASTAPSSSADHVDPSAVPTPSATTASTPPAASEPPKPNPGVPAPSGFTWIDTRAGYALAAQEPAGATDVACEVIDVATKKVVAKITGANTVAGGANPTCEQLSPAGHLVSIGNTRGMYWKNWQNKTTACKGQVAPDDSTCVEDDVTSFMFQPTDGPAADLDLHWSKAVVNGATKKVATIPRGLNRDGNTRKWWSVEYCSPSVAVIDDPKGLRTTIDATNGSVKSSRKSDGSPLCP